MRSGGRLASPTLGGWAAVAVFVLIAPLLLPDNFRLFTMIVAVTYLIVAIGTNVAFGYAGVFTIGYAAFALLGSYTVAICAHHGIPTPLGFVVAAVVCSVVGVITAIPALRLGSWAVAVMTLLYLPALSAMILHYRSFTGGAEGLFAGRSTLTLTQLWYLAATLAALIWFVVRNV
jgi:branched-chain amino acid transport system permease protein